MGQAVDAADRKIGALQCLEQDLQIIRVKAVVRIQKGKAERMPPRQEEH